MSGLQYPEQASALTREGLASKLITALIASAIAFVLFSCLGFVATNAYAAIYPVNESAQVDGASSEATSTSADESAAADTQADEDAAGSATSQDAEESEAIEDDETPMSSGLGGGEPISSGGLGFGTVAIAGIAAVAAFFFVLMRRLNGNINDMNRMFK